MKKLILSFLFLFIIVQYSYSQDTTKFILGETVFKFPVKDNLIVFTEVHNIDSLNKKRIFNAIKKELPKYFIQPNINISNSASFRTVLKGLDKQIVYEDFEEGIITAYLLTRYAGESDEYNKKDVLWLTTATFYVKDFKYKVSFESNKIYFQSAGVAFLAGQEASLLTYDLNEIYRYNNLKNEIELGGANPSYPAKRINTMFTLKKLLINKLNEKIVNVNNNENDF
jgi:hypothetical protein